MTTGLTVPNIILQGRKIKESDLDEPVVMWGRRLWKFSEKWQLG